MGGGAPPPADGARLSSQDQFRNMFFKRPADDTGLPPPKNETVVKTREEEEAELEAQMENDLFGDIPESKDIDPEAARLAAQLTTSKKSMVKDQQPLPYGWVERTSKKRASGKVYYVNLVTKKYQRERPVSDEAAALVEQPAAKKQKVKPKVTNVSEALVRIALALKREEKFDKASRMVIQLMQNNMDKGNAADFVKVIGQVLEKREWIHSHKLQPHYVRLIEAALGQVGDSHPPPRPRSRPAVRVACRFHRWAPVRCRERPLGRRWDRRWACGSSMSSNTRSCIQTTPTPLPLRWAHADGQPPL